MRGRIDCCVVALNIEILIFSCILNKIIHKFYYSFFFCTISIAITHALKGATFCLMGGGKKLGALEVGSLDGAVTVRGSRELSDGAGDAEKDGIESSYVRGSLI